MVPISLVIIVQQQESHCAAFSSNTEMYHLDMYTRMVFNHGCHVLLQFIECLFDPSNLFLHKLFSCIILHFGNNHHLARLV